MHSMALAATVGVQCWSLEKMSFSSRISQALRAPAPITPLHLLLSAHPPPTHSLRPNKSPTPRGPQTVVQRRAREMMMRQKGTLIGTPARLKAPTLGDRNGWSTYTSGWAVIWGGYTYRPHQNFGQWEKIERILQKNLWELRIGENFCWTKKKFRRIKMREKIQKIWDNFLNLPWL